MDVLLNTTNTKAVFFDQQTDTVVLSFTSLLGDDYDPEDDDLLAMDFKPLSSMYSTIYITDKTMSWGNHLEWELLSETIEPLLKDKKVIAIGLSMGGFNAIISSNFIKIDKVIAFSPQYTINTRLYPTTDYAEWSKRIKQWRFLTVTYGFKKHTDYLVVVGSEDINDTKFLHKFPPKVKIVNFGKNYGHNVPKNLKDKGVLYNFIDLAINNNLEDLYTFRDIYS